MSTPFDLQWGDSVWAKVVASNDYGDSIESYAGNGALLMTVPDAPINLAEDVSLRTENSITITWQEGVHNGGRQVIDYRVSYAEVNSDTWLIAAETVTKQNFWTTTGLTAGQTYKFRVESRNQLYFSDFSDSIEILCATKPETPNAPWNENILDQVNIYWQPSVDNGLPITSYILVIRTADNIYLQDLDNCDGSDSTIVQTTQCTVPLSTLTTAPYNLAVNEAINVMVAATNAYGTSDYSEIGSGALLQLVPDSPVNLVNVPDVTDATKIKIEWDDGPEHGGSTIIDYTVNYDQSTGQWIELVSGLIAREYTTTIDLVEGATYSFQVKARNTVGFSLVSSATSILVAQRPDKPILTTRVSDLASEVVIEWDVVARGSPVTSVQVWIRESDGLTFTTEQNFCITNDATVLSTMSCSVPFSVLISAPYHLPYGSSVFAKVSATNAYGTSEISDQENGAVILNVPSTVVVSNYPAGTAATKITIDWTEPVDDGGSDVIDYQIQYAPPDQDYSILVSGLTDRTYVIEPLQTGLVYSFKVLSRNQLGYSAPSEEVQILTAQIPDTVDEPTTEFDPILDTVIIRWTEPSSRGSSLLGYRVYIQESDGTFDKELDNCDGYDSNVMTNLQCSVPVNKLKQAPFSHPWGVSIYAYIVAVNDYGDSAPSERGNGAVIITKPDAPLQLIEDSAHRLPTQIGLEWLEGNANGGSQIIDYVVSYDQANEEWIEFQANILTTDLIVDSLTSGSIYKFKVQARNEYGLSDDSDIISILIADEPSQVAQPTTTTVNDNVVIDWNAPSHNGSPITRYQIMIQQEDGQYSEELSDCDGTLPATISSTSCTVPISTLTASPFSLNLGDEVFVHIIAWNLYGESIASDDGNGAIIALVPEAPVNLANDLSTTSATVIKITWDEGQSNNGANVIDYRVSFDQSIGSFVVLDDTVTDTHYTTSISLTPSAYYLFYVEARNTVGYSQISDHLTVHAVQIPDQPQAPVTSILGTDVIVDWVQPYDGDSAITSYKITFLANDGIFYEDVSVCDGSDSSIVSVTQCIITTSDFTQDPFLLPWGSSIYAKVFATNYRGDSLTSDAGNGALIQTNPGAIIDLSNDASVTMGDKIGLVWSDSTFVSGSAITDYKIEYDEAQDVFVTLETGITSQSYTVTQLVAGTTYQFKVYSRNAVGYSLESNTVAILAAQIPDTPAAPTTTINGDYVDITWPEVFAQGSVITEFNIQIRQADGSTYSLILANCDGRNQTIIDTRICTVPILTLRSSPFNHIWGNSIHAKVTAINAYGSSQTSQEGNGAVILTNPDTPLGLNEVILAKTATSITIQWSEGDANGGTEVIDYTVYRLEQDQTDEVLTDNVHDTTHTAAGLTTGFYYTFKVKARNSHGFSEYTEILTILCAEEPMTPDAPTTRRENDNIIIEWTEPFNNGAALLSYTVYIGKSDLTFSMETDSCDGADSTIMANTACTIAQSVLQAEPFNLVQGDSVYAKLHATNVFGDSLESEIGNGGLIATVPTAPINLQNDATVTDYSSVGLTLQPSENDGGDLVIDYEIYFAREGSFTFELLHQGETSTSHETSQPLVTGVTYQFFVKARNTVGVGAMSNTVSIILAQNPDAPIRVVTNLNDDMIEITWAAAQEGGSAIIGYQVLIRASDQTYHEEMTYCDGSDATIIADSACSIPKTRFLTSPFNIAWGERIYARVIAVNVVGESFLSVIGNDAILLREPDAPLNLANDASITTASQIGVNWQDGLEDGGTNVLDYNLFYDRGLGTSDFVILQSGLTQTDFTAMGLNAGTTYTFKVESRNEFGLSQLSEPVSILAAQAPAQPGSPTTLFAVDGTTVTVDWSTPSDMGSSILGYRIYIRMNDEATYHQEHTYCDGADATIISETSCTIPVATLMGSYFNLQWGSSVYAKVLAYNYYGDSLESDEGNGAVLVTVPDAPLLLREHVQLRGVTQIGLLWKEGAYNGGTTVLDYQLQYDDGTGYVQLATEIELAQFLVTSLTNGQHYKF